MAAVTATKRTRVKKAQAQQEDLRRRTAALLKTEIDFIPNPEFACEDAVWPDDAEQILTIAQQSLAAPAALPAHLRAMCEFDLLSHEEESTLFHTMNYLKFRANALRVRLDHDQLDAEAVEAIEARLQHAERIRDHIVKANTRLVISIVKKFVTPQHSFDDLLSNGIVTLMQTVEKFDIDRGFRFSTYAYRSISRNIYRTLANAKKEDARFTRDAEEWAFEQVDDRSSSLTDAVWSNLRKRSAALLQRLDKREQLIIRSRYALGAHRKVRTFQYIADKLGISKERVRQLEQRAVSKLRDMASEFDTDELFSAAMV